MQRETSIDDDEEEEEGGESATAGDEKSPSPVKTAPSVEIPSRWRS